ncbi:HAD family hydrolase [Streptomyces palmae]|uniref:HAD family hydrolase n=1 Tax=Streptomyces palmae TaxID=1701085 RepID=A0A4Z0G8M5_9ACTN|nr:HAD family hydrolase [Streptomyces palmae]TGA92094.1 HAD family hydrolase [Streptomyces palmae]
MSVLVASDLDRTLIYSAAALGLDMPDDEAPRLLCVEVYDRRPLSYMTEQAATLLAEVARTSLFVPATTRTREQYRRVRLPGPPPRFAVCANGGHLLVDGESDPEWHKAVRASLEERCAPLDEIRARIQRTADPAWLRKERVAEDLFAYLVVERDLLPPDYVRDLTEWAEPREWTVSLQGRKVYAVPKPLTKSAAVAEIARRTGASEILAAGDSLLDADLLYAADHGWRPAHGELATQGWLAPHVTAVPEQGVAAGEAIAAAIAEHASTARARARSEAAIRVVSRSRH